MFLCAAAIVATTGAPASTAADVDGDKFVSREWGVSLRAPSPWQMSERTSYPNILLWMTHSQPPGRMLLSVEVHDDKLDARTYAERTAALLTELGFSVRARQRHPGTGAWYFDFDNCAGAPGCEGKAFMRQAFLVEGRIGYALTLAAGDVYARGRLLRAWDLTLKSIKLDRADRGADTKDRP